MDDYNSILKEKKVYKDPEPIIKKNKYLKYIFFQDIALLMLLIIAYIIYYNKVLTPINILNSNISKISNEIDFLLEPLHINDDMFQKEGTIIFDENIYSYKLGRNKEIFKLTLSNDKDMYTLYSNGISSYIKFNGFMDNFYIEDSSNWLGSLLNIESKLMNTLQNNDFIKRFYIENKRPVVEVNLTLDEEKLNQILGTDSVTDKVQVLLTIKNDALENELIDTKVTINNITKNDRRVINYNKNSLMVTDNAGKTERYVLQKTNKGFTIKRFKSDILYSVLSGKVKDDSYQYNYQIIDQLYTLTFSIDNNNTYRFQSKIDNSKAKLEKEVLINNHDIKSVLEEEKVVNILKYDSLSEKNRKEFDQLKLSFFLPISKFIDKHKNSID